MLDGPPFLVSPQSINHKIVICGFEITVMVVRWLLFCRCRVRLQLRRERSTAPVEGRSEVGACPERAAVRRRTDWQT